MSQHYIWSELALRNLIDDPDPKVQEWAVDRLFRLYPAAARNHCALLLEDSRERVVMSAMGHLPGQEAAWHELAPILRALYIEGPSAVSALAIRTLGLWGISEAVEAVQERILQGTLLSREQIDSMVEALGFIREESAYNLLKKTESAIQNAETARWRTFYTALLSHRKVEDMRTLIGVFMDGAAPEQKRHEALRILQTRVDPVLNVPDLLYGNYPAVQQQLSRRLAWLKEEMEGRCPAQGRDQWIEEIEQLLHALRPESTREAAERLDTLSREIEAASGYAKDLFGAVRAHLHASPETGDNHFALVCVGISSLIEALIAFYASAPREDAPWREKLSDLLKDRYPREDDSRLEDLLIAEAPPSELVALLIRRIEKEPESWGAFRAVEMLGKMKAAEATDVLASTLGSVRDSFFREKLKGALLAIGPSIVPALVRLLDDADPAQRLTALSLLAECPTAEVLRAVADRFASLFALAPQSALDAAMKLGSEEFVPLLEQEYRTGEWDVGDAYLLICRIHHLQPPRLSEIERDVRRGKDLSELHRQILEGNTSQWPTTILLELACKECGRTYHYEVSDVHLHRYVRQAQDDQEQDGSPYKNGVVICDDLRCKNCRALNQVELTPATINQLTAESVKILAFQRGGLSVPSYYPVKYVQLPEPEKGKSPPTLVEVEKEHIEAVRNHPTKPQGHLALGKFYEYVKVFPKAREAYLKALDLDAQALEAMAGLARLYHIEGKRQEAYDWIERCYQDLARGRIYLAADPKEFKKRVREKRREFAREVGAHPKDEPIEVRFQIEEPNFPKNRPCPCGSGKKYKVCCMGKGAGNV